MPARSADRCHDEMKIAVTGGRRMGRELVADHPRAEDSSAGAIEQEGSMALGRHGLLAGLGSSVVCHGRPAGAVRRSTPCSIHGPQGHGGIRRPRRQRPHHCVYGTGFKPRGRGQDRSRRPPRHHYHGGNMSLGVSLLTALTRVLRRRPRLTSRSGDASPPQGRCALRNGADAGRELRGGPRRRLETSACAARRRRCTAARRHRLPRCEAAATSASIPDSPTVSRSSSPTAPPTGPLRRGAVQAALWAAARRQGSL